MAATWSTANHDVPARPRAGSLRTSAELGNGGPRCSAAVPSLDLGSTANKARTEDVLVATTSSAAELLGLDCPVPELRTIEPGKQADLVLVDGDRFDLH